MDNKKKRISTRLKACCVFFITAGAILLSIELLLRYSMTKFTENLVSQTEQLALKFVDETDHSPWAVNSSGFLSKGMITIGDGNPEHANNAYFNRINKEISDPVAAVGAPSDDLNQWIKNTDYIYAVFLREGFVEQEIWEAQVAQNGRESNYLGVAGTTNGDSNKSVAGFFVRDDISNALDLNGTAQGTYQLNGVECFCLYRTITNNEDVVIGALAVGIKTEKTHYVGDMSSLYIFLVLSGELLIVFGIAFLLINRSLYSVKKIELFTNEIGRGNFPKEELKVRDFYEIREIASAVNQMNASLIEKFNTDKELEAARKMQQNLLVHDFPVSNKYEVYGKMIPAKEVGGDFYDVFKIKNDYLAFLVADVSGKGVSAALFMAMAKGIIEDCLLGVEGMSKAITVANHRIMASNELGFFITAWIGLYDLRNNTITFVNAGHNPPILRNKDGVSFFKTETNIPLGSFDDFEYQCEEMKVEKGDSIILYTDGVTEAFNVNKELFGENRLLEYAKQNKDSVIKECDELFDEVEKYQNGVDQSDDITVLELKIK